MHGFVFCESSKFFLNGCQAVFDRMVAKGKNKKLVIIAECNKLLKKYLQWQNLAFYTAIIIVEIWPKIFGFLQS
jgi:hypothetical protein